MKRKCFYDASCEVYIGINRRFIYAYIHAVVYTPAFARAAAPLFHRFMIGLGKQKWWPRERVDVPLNV